MVLRAIIPIVELGEVGVRVLSTCDVLQQVIRASWCRESSSKSIVFILFFVPWRQSRVHRTSVEASGASISFIPSRMVLHSYRGASGVQRCKASLVVR